MKVKNEIFYNLTLTCKFKFNYVTKFSLNSVENGYL